MFRHRLPKTCVDLRWSTFWPPNAIRHNLLRPFFWFLQTWVSNGSCKLYHLPRESYNLHLCIKYVIRLPHFKDRLTTQNTKSWDPLTIKLLGMMRCRASDVEQWQLNLHSRPISKLSWEIALLMARVAVRRRLRAWKKSITTKIFRKILSFHLWFWKVEETRQTVDGIQNHLGFFHWRWTDDRETRSWNLSDVIFLLRINRKGLQSQVVKF